MLKYHRIWVVGRPPSYPPIIPPLRALAYTIETHFIWQSREDFQGITVSLWIRKANDPVSLAPPPGRGLGPVSRP